VFNIRSNVLRLRGMYVRRAIGINVLTVCHGYYTVVPSAD